MLAAIPCTLRELESVSCLAELIYLKTGYHIAGGCVTMLYPIHAGKTFPPSCLNSTLRDSIAMLLELGAPIVILPRFEPTSFLEAIERFSITVMVVAPPILMFFLNSPLIEKYNVTSLRTILCGSAPASSALITNTTRRLWSRGTKGAP